MPACHARYKEDVRLIRARADLLMTGIVLENELDATISYRRGHLEMPVAGCRTVRRWKQSKWSGHSEHICVGAKGHADSIVPDRFARAHPTERNLEESTADMSDAQFGTDPDVRRIPRARMVLYLALAIVCLSFFGAIRMGIDRGLPDSIGEESWGRVLFAIGAAITEMEHGGYGYTIASVMETVLTSAGLTGDPKILADLGVKFPDNLHSPELINAAIDKAVHFKWPFNPNEAIRGSGGDDLGLVDYTRLSFYLFGYRIQSLYVLYFVILAISVTSFLWAFRAQPGFLLLAATACAAQVLLFASSLFNQSNLGTTADPRFLSVLAIIPGMHLACLIISKSRPTPINIGLAVLQSVILIFAFWIRSTAIWVLTALSLLAIAVALWKILQRRFNWRALWCWGILLGVWGLQAFLGSTALHPVYRDKGEISHHIVWHSLFYQLQFHPRWEENYASQYDHAVYDDLPQVAAKRYLLRNPPPDPQRVYLTEDHQYLQVAASETYIRKAFFEFFSNDPAFVLETYLIYSPAKIFQLLGALTRSLPLGIENVQRLDSSIWVRAAALLLCLALIVLAALLALDDVDSRRAALGALLVTVGFLLSLLPILPAPDFHTVADQYYLLLIVLVSWTTVGLCFGIRVCLRPVSRQNLAA